MRTHVERAGLKELADLKQLTLLSIDGGKVTDAGLAELKHLKQLATLYLGGAPLTGADFAELKDLKQLTSLDLQFTGVTDAGLAELKHLKQLTSLNLTGCVQVTDAGVKELKDLKQLTTLYLTGVFVTDAGLAELKDLKQLTSLSLGSTRVTAAGVKELQAALPELKIEEAPDPKTEVPPADAAEAKAARAITKLCGAVKQDNKLPGNPVIGVDLIRTQVTDAGMKELADLKQLTTLMLYNTKVTDAGLAELKELRQLKTLYLNGTQVTDAGLKELVDLKRLTWLGLLGTKVTDAGVKELQAALPHCQIQAPVKEQEDKKPLPKDPDAKAKTAAPAAHVKKPGVVVKAPGSHTHDVALSPDGKILARAGSGQIDGWDVASGKQLGTLTGQPHFYKVAFSPDGKTLASIGGDVEPGKYEVVVKLWDVATGKERVLGKGQPIRAFSMAFSPDGKTLATSYLDPAAVKLWDVANGKEKMELGGAWGSLAFSPDGKTLAVGDRSVHLWDLTTGKKRVSLARKGDWMDLRPFATSDVLGFSPDGKTLVSAGLHKGKDDPKTLHAQLTLWDVATARERAAIAIPGYSVPNAPPFVFTADGKTLITAVWIFEDNKGENSNGRVSVQHWDLATGKARANFWTPVSPGGNHPEAGHVVGFFFAALSADGKTVAWGGAEGDGRITGTAHVWEVQSLATSPPKVPKEIEEKNKEAAEKWKDIEDLRGTWKLRAVEINGRRKDPKHLQTEMRIDWTGLELAKGHKDGTVFSASNYPFGNHQIDASRRPKAIDIVSQGKSFSSGNPSYISVKAIYLLEGDRLTICRGRERTLPEGFVGSSIETEPRPTEFKTQPDDGLTLEIYERVPPAPPEPPVPVRPIFIKPGETKTVTLGDPGKVGGPLHLGDGRAVGLQGGQGWLFKEGFTLIFADTDVPKGVTFEPARPVVKNPGEVPKFTIRATKDAALGDFAIAVWAMMKGGNLRPGGGFVTFRLNLSVDPAGEAAREQSGKPPRRYLRRTTYPVVGGGFDFSMGADEVAHDGEILTSAGGKFVMKSKDGTEHSYTLADKAQITYQNAGPSLEALKPGTIVRVTANKAKPHEATRIEAVISYGAFMAEYLEGARQKEERERQKKVQQEIERQKKVQQEIDHLQGTWLVVSSQTGDEKEPPESLKKQRVIIKGDHLTLAFGNERNEKRAGTIKIDPQAKSLDWVIPMAGDAAMKAIYDLKGDDLKIGFGVDNLLRPTRFEMGKDQVGWLLFLKREREDAKPAPLKEQKDTKSLPQGP